jgi:hypothetical protein
VPRAKSDVAGYKPALFALAAILAQCFLNAGTLGPTKS